MVYWIYKMAKKKSWLQENQTLIGLIIIAIILWKGGEAGWFSKNATYNIENVEGDTITNQETINQLENPTPGDLCTIDCVPNNINLGQSSTCTLRDGINANCLIYFRYNSGDWKYLATVTTDAGGIYRETRTPGYAGYYEFAAICDDCVTNKETVIVNTPTDDSSDGDDTDPYDPANYPCEWVINPTSQASCDGHPGCYDDVESYCLFQPATSATPAKCVCARQPNSCENLCYNSGFYDGYCTYQITKDPCGSSYDMIEGNQYCTGGDFGFGACCCHYN